MLHIPEKEKTKVKPVETKKETIEKVNSTSKVEKGANQNKTISNVKVEQDIVSKKDITEEKEQELKYNGLYAYEIMFASKSNRRCTLVCIARTEESAKNRFEDSSMGKFISIRKFSDKESKELVLKEKKAGLYTQYLKRLD